MNDERDGGQAFPTTFDRCNGVAGMTLRDYFAAQTLVGLLASPRPPGGVKRGAPIAGDAVAELAYAMADEMLMEREK